MLVKPMMAAVVGSGIRALKSVASSEVMVIWSEMSETAVS